MLLEYNDGTVVMFLKREDLFFIGLFFRSLCWNIYSRNDKCPAEHRALVINSRSPGPGEDCKHFCPLHLGICVARKNTG